MPTWFHPEAMTIFSIDMSKYNTIAVIYGSDSSEWEISCRSGEFTASRIDGTKYNVYEIFARFGRWSLAAFRKRNSVRTILPENCRPEIDKTDFSVTLNREKVKFGSFVSTITFDKFTCKNYLRNVDYVKCADDVFIRQDEVTPGLGDKVISALGLPLFVKPTDGGSSFGVVKVKQADEFDGAVKTAFSEGRTIIAEQFIPGRELTNAVYFNGKELVALPVIEIVTEHEFFDYDAKYNGFSEEICPARISGELTARIQEASRKIYRRLGCSGLVRVDYILSGDDLYFLEVNTIPGMTSASLVPKMVRTAGMDITDFLTEIIENS